MSDLLVNIRDGYHKISQINFGILSSEETAKLATIECINRSLYTENKQPVPFGPVDPRLGVNQRNMICPTCNKKIEACPGHFGVVRLSLPIFHIGFFKNVLEILKCICKNCSRILLNSEDKSKYLNILNNLRKRKNISHYENIFKEIKDCCKKTKICPFCSSINGTIKHIQGMAGPTIIVHEYNKSDKIIGQITEITNKKYETANILFSQKDSNKQNNNNNIFQGNNTNTSLLGSINSNQNNKMSIELSSTFVYNLFANIPREDYIFFNLNLEPPINLLLKYVIVPPLPIRPTVQMGINVTNEDDLTIKIREMIHVNKNIQSYIDEGNGNTYKLIDDCILLQSTHAYYINSDTKGINKNIVGSKQIRSLASRLKGKTGRFRGNLSGKRVDFSGRTVISPDPNLDIDQVGVPVHMAKILTYPERVNEFNIDFLKKLIINGPDEHPGANFVITNNGENKVYLGYTNRKKLCDELRIGDIVERHLINSDSVLFNRQPSLHRVSIMAFRARILPGRTLRFNESCCTPFNADFDGDEMNLHVPQTEEARAEAKELMSVIKNMRSPKAGEPLVASTQDFLTTFYLLTQRDFFLDRAHFWRSCTYFADAKETIEIPEPAILKPKELWTGKQLFSLLLRPNKKSKVIINLKAKSKSFSRMYKKDEFRCPNDGFVYIKNSELLTGIIDKNTIGNGSKNGIVFTLLKDVNRELCAQVLTRISKFSARWLCNYGMTFGLSDVTPRKDLVENKEKIVQKSYEESDKQIDLYNKGQIQLKPGMNAEDSLESSLNKILSDVRETVGKNLRAILPRDNSALIMAASGSKGSDINLSQMIGCVGQQIVNGKRMPDGFENRSLPHFEKYSKYPKAKGFVRHSFYDGLDATEFFFHTMGGREGLVDSAVKTAETGYMQRRLMKALEDLTVQYNDLVTMSSGEIVQFKYGDDGIDPMQTDTDGKIVFLPRLWETIESFYSLQGKNEHIDLKKDILNKNEVIKLVKEYIGKSKENGVDMNENLENDLLSFFEQKGEESEKHYNNYKKFKNIVIGLGFVNKEKIDKFFKVLWHKYQTSKISPGEAVGAVAGQSIGEPGTQMTLKTFHFAGVASMNITLGVPRIKEIINYTKNISTPIISAKLIQENDLTVAKIVKARIEKISLKRVAKYIREVISKEGAYIKIKLDRDYIVRLGLEISTAKIKIALIENKKKLKLKDQHIIIEDDVTLKILPPDTTRDTLFFCLERLKRDLPDTMVSGISTISRIVINKDESNESYVLTAEGTGLLEVMQIDGVDYRHVNTNNLNEIEKTLGVEAARRSIIYEINYTFAGYSINVDKRHLGLIADLMTFKGAVYGFQRFGMSRMKDSVLLHSSFERTNDVLFNAAANSKVDKLKGVSESIITGKMISIGTGFFKLLYDNKEHNNMISRKTGTIKENWIGNSCEFAKDIKFNLLDKLS